MGIHSVGSLAGIHPVADILGRIEEAWGIRRFRGIDLYSRDRT